MSSKLTRDVGTAFTVLKRMVRPRISRVGVSITYDCNQKCKTCDIWRINKEDSSLRKKEMKLSEFEQFCYVNKHLVWIALTGGEPYLKKDMKGFLDACCTIPDLRLISITTNGSIPDKIEDDLLYFLDNSNKKVTLSTQVSFEGSPEVHDEISGTRGSYKKALDSLRRIQRLEKESSRIRSGVSFTMSALGIKDFRNCLDSLGSSLPPVGQVQIGIGQYADYYQWVDEKMVVPDYKEMVKELKWFRKQFTFRDKLDPYGLISDAYLRKAIQCYGNGIKLPRCVAGEYTCSIGPYWDVHPCLFMFQNSLGNLKGYKYDLQLLMDSSEHTWKPLVDECVKDKGCWTLCEDYIMVVMRPWRVL